GGSISTTGLFTAGTTTGGPFTVTTSSGGINGTASVTVTAVNSPPTVATPAAASPNPVSAKTTNLSVLGADDGGEANLTYTWATTGNPPAAVTFSANGTNASKNIVATFAKAGSYAFQVTIKDQGNLTATSNVSVTVLTAVVTYVQGSGSFSSSSTTSIAQAFTTPNTSGKLIVAAVSWGSNDSVTCSDSQGNSYAVATTQYDSTNNQSLAICYA